MASFHMTSPWLPTAALAASGMLLGFAAAAVVGLGIESERIQDLENRLVVANAQVDALQTAAESVGLALAMPTSDLPQQTSTEFQVSALPSPAVTTRPETVAAMAMTSQPKDTPAVKAPAAQPPPTKQVASTKPAPPAPNPVVPTVKAAPPVPKPQTPIAKPTPAAAETKSTATTGRIELPTPTITATADNADMAMPRKKPPEPVQDDELKAAISKNAIEMAPKSKMGVEKLETGGVVMSSGIKVRVGDRFNSGERLLDVDLATGRIVTDKRTVVIMN